MAFLFLADRVYAELDTADLFMAIKRANH